MLATTRAPRASRVGRSCSSQASTPGFWRPTLFNIPAAVSCSLGGGLPAHGSAERDFTTTAPSPDRSTYSPSSVPCPAVPDAVMTGLGNSTLPTVVDRSKPSLRILRAIAVKDPQRRRRLELQA